MEPAENKESGGDTTPPRVDGEERRSLTPKRNRDEPSDREVEVALDPLASPSLWERDRAEDGSTNPKTARRVLTASGGEASGSADDGVYGELGLAEDMREIFGPAPVFPDLGASPSGSAGCSGAPVGGSALNRGVEGAVLLDRGSMDVVGRGAVAGRVVVDECLDGGVDALAWRSSGPESSTACSSSGPGPGLGPPGQAPALGQGNSVHDGRCGAPAAAGEPVAAKPAVEVVEISDGSSGEEQGGRAPTGEKSSGRAVCDVASAGQPPATSPEAAGSSRPESLTPPGGSDTSAVIVDGNTELAPAALDASGDALGTWWTMREGRTQTLGPPKHCEYRIDAVQRCTRGPRILLPVLDGTRVAGETVDQLGCWWCAEHARIILAVVNPGPVARRDEESWLRAVTLAARQTGAHDRHEEEVEEFGRLQAHLRRAVEAETELQHEVDVLGKDAWRLADEEAQEVDEAVCSARLAAQEERECLELSLSLDSEVGRAEAAQEAAELAGQRVVALSDECVTGRHGREDLETRLVDVSEELRRAEQTAATNQTGWLQADAALAREVAMARTAREGEQEQRYEKTMADFRAAD